MLLNLETSFRTSIRVVKQKIVTMTQTNTGFLLMRNYKIWTNPATIPTPMSLTSISEKTIASIWSRGQKWYTRKSAKWWRLKNGPWKSSTFQKQATMESFSTWCNSSTQENASFQMLQTSAAYYTKSQSDKSSSPFDSMTWENFMWQRETKKCLGASSTTAETQVWTPTWRKDSRTS